MISFRFVAFSLLASLLFITAPELSSAASTDSPPPISLPSAPSGHIPGEHKFFAAAYFYIAHPGRILDVTLPYFRQASGLMQSAFYGLLRFFNLACGALMSKESCWNASPQNPTPYLLRPPGPSVVYPANPPQKPGS